MNNYFILFIGFQNKLEYFEFSQNNYGCKLSKNDRVDWLEAGF